MIHIFTQRIWYEHKRKITKKHYEWQGKIEEVSRCKTETSQNYPSPIPRHFRGALDKRDAKVVAETVIKTVKETGVARI